MSDPDAVVVGSGPNGLMAAVVLARAGREVLVVEAADTPGGGTRSEAMMVPGIVHDVCSAIHPLAVASPAFRELAEVGLLAEHGLRWIHPDIPVTHPLDGGRVGVLRRSVVETAEGLGVDRSAYERLMDPLVEAGTDLVDGLLSPLSVPPRHPVDLARFAVSGVRSAHGLARRRFESDEGRALFAGLAAHSLLSLRSPITAGYGLTLGTLAHLVGWPMAAGGSQRIADALVATIESLGGRVECGRRVDSLDELPSAAAVVLDVTPRQVVDIAGDRLPSRYRRSLSSFRYGPGVFKVDWVLDGPVPWADPHSADAGTVHLGGTLEEVTAAEDDVVAGRHPERPYVLIAQHTRFDPSRVDVAPRPSGQPLETLWGYCHVPNGSSVDMTDRIERQIERFAPGFRDRVLHRHTMSTGAMERHDANYIGGDINGGAGDLRQIVARPTWGLHPWRTPVDGLWLCSASTPPGGGVHGMGGWHAAHDVLRRT